MMMLQKKNSSRWLRTLLSTKNAKKHNRGTQARTGRKMLLESLERREVFDAGWAVGMQGATVTDMVTDAAGNTFITGGAPGGQAVFGNGTLSTGTGVLYVAKSNSSGQFLWAVQFGSTSSADTGSKAIALDTSGNAIIAGKFIGSVQFGSLALTSAGGTDAFLAKLDGNDGRFVWAQSRGGTGDDFAFDVAVDFNDSAILAGGMDTVFANDQGVATPLVIVSKVDATGTEVWTSNVTGNASGALSGRLESLTVDTSGAIYASGRFKGTADFPTGAISSVAYLPTYNGGKSADPLVSKLDSNGQWLWARSLPVDTTGIVFGSVVGPDSQLYIAGSFEGTAHFDSTTLTSAGKRDGFVSRLDPTTGVVGWAQRFGGNDVDTASAIQLDNMGRPVVVGTFNGTAVFGSQTLIANPTQNPFISVFSNSGTFLESHRLGNGANTTYGVGLGIDTSGAIYTSGSNAGVQTMQLPQQQLTLGTTGTSLNGYIVKLPPAAATKFYVVDDATKDRTYQYASSGELTIDNFSMNTGNTAPRGAASNAAGSTVWVGDKNRNVYVYSNSGALQGSWTASSLSSTAVVEGVATNGTDVWIVDNKTDKVFKHTGAASRISGSQSAASSFSLNSANTNPKGIVTDGTSIWVLNDSTTDKIFKYTVSQRHDDRWLGILFADS